MVDPVDDPTDGEPADDDGIPGDPEPNAAVDPASSPPADPDPAADVTASPSPDATVDEHTTDWRTLTPSVQLVWAVRVLFGVVVVGILGFVVAGQLNVDRGFVSIGAAALLGLGLVWVHLRYRVWTFRVREDALYLERGVITNVKTVAPHVRIQHVDTSRGPLERALGLSTLVVYTAGSRGADVSIPGLTTDEAADLQQRVKELAIAAEGGDAL